MSSFAGAAVAYSSMQKVVILIVEDEALIRVHAADIIRDLGFEVIEAANADQAISLLESAPEISVVFTSRCPARWMGSGWLKWCGSGGRRWRCWSRQDVSGRRTATCRKTLTSCQSRTCWATSKPI
ncbi:hypothetical protein [Bradyrhizobium sp.]|uniref:hypothetical protein n=1 Tax=Bradyrhizobium sp. TaxID=376 RepID=UPI0034252551